MRTIPRSARGNKGISRTGIVSIAGHPPEVSEEAGPRLSRARRRAIVMFNRDHREQVPGRRHRVPAGILHPRQVPRHPPEVCEDVSGRLNRRMEPQRRIGRRAEADSTEAVRVALMVGSPVRERRRYGPSERPPGPIEKPAARIATDRRLVS